MTIKIVTDSASDIPQALAKEWNITVLPLTIRFGEEEFSDGVTLMPDQFFRKLEAGPHFPKTSQITPYIYNLAFADAVRHGDDVVCFCLSSGVSGSFQSACFAAAGYEGHVFVIDTRQFCISQYVIVKRAVELRDAGFPVAELVTIITEELRHAHVLAAFDTLEYLKRGGRLSGAAAAVGGLLNIKPVLTITDGVVDVLGKARGMRKACDMLMQELEKLGEVDFTKPVCFGCTAGGEEGLHLLKARFFEVTGCEGDYPQVEVGATIGAYAGPKAVACAFFTK